jgi:hypothetical protein
MSLTPSAIRNAIVATLAARYPALTVEAHGGQFTERELALLLAKAPAILVACISVTGLTAAGPNRWKGDLKWALYVFGADTATTARDVLALDTVFELLTWVPEQKWGIADARLPERDTLTADNLYTGQTTILRVAVWALTWTQPFFFAS